MAITLVQSKTGSATGTTATVSVTLTTPTTAGNSIIIAVAVDTTAGAVSATGGGTYTVDADINSNNLSTGRMVILSAHNITAGVTTITITPLPTGKKAIIVAEFSGVSARDQFATNFSNSNVASMPVGPTPTTTSANELVIAAWGTSAIISDLTKDPAYTLIDTASASSKNNMTLYKTVTTTGPQSATITESPFTDPYAAAIVTYSPTVTSVTHNGASTTTGVGTTTADAAYGYVVDSSMTGVGTASASAGFPAASSMTSVGTASAVPSSPAPSSNMNAVASASATANTKPTGSSMTGVATGSGVATRGYPAASTTTGAATGSGVAVLGYGGATSTTGATAISALAGLKVNGASTFTGATTLSSDAIRAYPGVSSSQAVSTIPSISPTTIQHVDTTITGASVIHQVVLNGLVGYWNSLQGVNGQTWNNIAPNTSTKYAATWSGKSTVRADGMNIDLDDFISIPTPDELKVVTDFTLEMRVKLSSYDGWHRIITNDVGTTTVEVNGRYSLWYVGPYDPVAKDGDMSLVGASMADGKEYYVSYTYTQATGDSKCYVNGQLSSMWIHITGLKFTSGNTFYINDSNHKYPFSGVVDSLRLYNRVLTNAEMKQNYKVGSAVGFGPMGSVTISNAETNGTTVASMVSVGTGWSQTPLSSNDWAKVDYDNRGWVDTLPGSTNWK